MTDKELLTALFHDNLLTFSSQNEGRTIVRMKENDLGAHLKRVDLYDVSADSILINLDKSNPPDSLFKKSGGTRKRCDYVLITDVKDKKYLFFIELKSGKIPRDIKQQFKGAEYLIDYCEATLKCFYHTSDFFNNYEKRFICFYTPTIAKQVTRPSKRKNAGQGHTTPEKMLKYPAPQNPSIFHLI